jgi:type IV pilus assembly protein PilC
MRKVKGALVYPGVIMTVAGAAIAILLIFVIPVFQSMFSSVNMDLPLPTRIVIMLSDLLIGYWWALLLGIGAVSLRDPRYYGTSERAEDYRLAAAQVPGPGRPARKSAVSRFTRTLGTLISSGVSILEGLEITAKTAATWSFTTRSWHPGSRSRAARPSPRHSRSRRCSRRWSSR